MSITWSSASVLSADIQQSWVRVGTDLFAQFGGSAGIVAEYDPGTETFSTTAVAEPPWSPAMEAFVAVSRLNDGRILAAGGGGNVETYIGTYAAGDFTWVASTDLPFSQAEHAQTVLPDGRVFVVDVVSSGTDATVWLGTVSGDTITWVEATVTGGTADLTDGARAVTLPDGRVLVAFSMSFMVFATITGDDIEWEEAVITGSATAVGYYGMAALWSDAVLFAGGYDSGGTYPADHINDVVHAGISGADITLSAFDALPETNPEFTVSLFRLSDNAVLALYYDLDTTDAYAALGADSDPPAGTIEETELAAEGSSSAGFTGGAVIYRPVNIACASDAAWVNPDRAFAFAWAGASAAAFIAPTYAKLTVPCSSGTTFPSSRKVPTSLYWRATSECAFKARFEKPTTLRFFGRSAVAFRATPRADGALNAPGAGVVAFVGRTLRQTTLSSAAASSFSGTWRQLRLGAFGTGAGSAAAFAASPLRGAVAGVVAGSGGSFAGTFSTVALGRRYEGAEAVHVLLVPEQINIGSFL